MLSWQGRRSRIVAKALLQLDPAFDILLNRLPNRFISPGAGSGHKAITAITGLAGSMTARDAFVIRRVEGSDVGGSGRGSGLRRAHRLGPPRHGSRPLAIHPGAQRLLIKWYVVDAAIVPADDAARDDMLFRAWEAIDEWIDAREPPTPNGSAAGSGDRS